MWEEFREGLETLFALHVNHVIERLEPLEKKVDSIMSDLGSFDNALATLQASVTQLSNDNAALIAASNKTDADIVALIAKVAAGQPVNLAAELTAIQATNAAILSSDTLVTQATASANAADLQANPPVTPPVVAPPTNPPAA